MAESKKIPNYVKYIIASLSGIGSTLACFPMELLKTRMQVFGEGGRIARPTSFQLAKDIINKEGFFAIYSGLSASVLRQATYTGMRVGSYQAFIEYVTEDGVPPNILIKALCGIFSGALGGLVGLPADLCLTRMAADGNAPPEKRRNYKNVFNAMTRITKEEGFLVLFRGLNPTVVRAAIVNISQLVSYSQAKETLIKYDLMEDNALCHLACSVFSALVSTTCVLPPDIAKIRIQNMVVIQGKPEYRGMLDAWIKIVTREGFFALWKGFTPLFLKNGPQFIVLFELHETFTHLYKTLVLDAPSKPK